MYITQSRFSLLDREELGLPPTAMTNVSSETPTAPQAPASVAKATKATPVKSMMSCWMQWVENLFLLCDQCIFPCILIQVRNRICFVSVTKLNSQNFSWWELSMEMYKQTLTDTTHSVWVLGVPFLPFFRCWWTPAPSSCLCHGNQTRCWGSACSQTCSVSSISSWSFSSSGISRRCRRKFFYTRSESGSCKHGKLKCVNRIWSLLLIAYMFLISQIILLYYLLFSVSFQ